MQLSLLTLALTKIYPKGQFTSSNLDLDFTSGNDTLDSRITFSRASNATVVGKDGTIQYAPHNLLTYSEQFDNAAWSKSNSTVTANAVVAPDGTTTADSIIVTTGGSTDTGVRITTTQAASTVYTTSVYAKYLNTRYLVIRNLAVGATLGAQWVFFDLINGRVGVTGTGITASITSVGNGWYRCSATATTLSTITNNLVDYRLSDVDGSYTVTTGSNIYLWGAQLNVGALQPYYPTTVKNLLGYTQEFDNAAWTKSNSFVQTNQIRNNTMQGAVAGTPGTLPTNWAATTAAGITRQLVGIGIEDGVTYIEYRFSGTATGPSDTQFDASNVIAATSGQAWSSSAFVKLQAGSLTNVTVTQIVAENNSSGNFLVASTQNIVPTSAGLQTQRFALTRTLNNASTAFVTTALRVSAAGAIDITLRIGMPQLVQGSSAGDVVATYGTAKAVMYQAPDGTLSADKLVEDAANTAHFIGSSATVTLGTTYSFSCYAKEAQSSPKRYLSLLLPSSQFGSNKRATFDLSAGTVVPTNSPLTASMTSVGSGWWRCEISAIATTGGTTNPYIRIFNATPDTLGSYQGDGTSGIYVWGAQLSDSASLDPYVYNPGAAPSAGPYYGPRFDYDPVTLQPKGLLIEEQRTNLILNSQAITLATWGSSGNVTFNANSAIAPDGTQSASAVMETSAVTISHTIGQTFTVAANTTYAASIYLKANGRDQAIVYYGLAGSPYTRVGVRVNLTTGTAVIADVGSPTSVTMQSLTAVGNGWYRVTVAGIADTTFTTGLLEVRYFDGTTSSYTGDPSKGMYIWGGQVELGSFPTSYIPTTSAQATRAADVATMTGTNFSSWYNQSEGTLFVDSSTNMRHDGTNAFPRVASISDGTLNNRLEITYGVLSAYTDNRSALVANGSLLIAAGSNKQTNGAMRTATAFSSSSSATYDSSSYSIAGSGAPSGLPATKINIGSDEAAGSSINGHIKRLAYWPRRLSDAELQGITS